MIKPGMRIAINAKHSINPSLVINRMKCTPMVCQVSHVVVTDEGVLLEGNNNYLYQVKPRTILDQLAKRATDLDNLVPLIAGKGETFKGVSIE